MEKLVVLSGAGMSAESGIQTFRDKDGLWEGHDVMEVATPEGFGKNPELVLEFYNQRRQQLKEVHPNYAHQKLADLEENLDVRIVTQNVDDLHERAGSSKVVHLHGELTKVRSTGNPSTIMSWETDLVLGDNCKDGFQLRPHIVWFGEAVPELETAVPLVADADIILVVGTSMQVYPAAGLVGYALPGARIFYLDPKPSINYELAQRENLVVIEKTAVNGIDEFIKLIK
jgi:NAD-dependent deacetylase